MIEEEGLLANVERAATIFRERLDAEPLGEVVGADRCVFVAGDAQETPSAMRIDASGQIVFKHLGALTPEVIEREIFSRLEGPAGSA